MICFPSPLIKFEWIHKYQDLFTHTSGEHLPQEVDAFIVEILSYIPPIKFASLYDVQRTFHIVKIQMRVHTCLCAVPGLTTVYCKV